MKGRLLLLGLFGLLLLVPAGCSTYQRVDRSTLVQGEAVRVRLSPQESANQAGTLGSFRDNLVGTIQSLNDERLGLTVSAAQAAGTPVGSSFRSYVEVSWDGVTEVERREFSWVRTGLAAAAAGTVAILILELTNPSAGSGSDGPGVNENRVRIPLRW